jgi:hypothetical protein
MQVALTDACNFERLAVISIDVLQFELLTVRLMQPPGVLRVLPRCLEVKARVAQACKGLCIRC